MRIHIAVSQPSIMDSRGSSAYYEGVASTVANHSSKETAGYHAPAPRQEQSHAQASPGPALVAQALSGNRDIYVALHCQHSSMLCKEVSYWRVLRNGVAGVTGDSNMSSKQHVTLTADSSRV